MAGRGGTMQVAAAAGVAAGTGAAQLGLGYGLGVVVWPATPGVDDSVWLGSLGWATWIAASSTVLGAVVAGRLRGGQGGAWRFVLAVAAGFGALLTVALVAVPARLTDRPQTPSPVTVAAGYALVGVLIGVVIAYWAVFSRPVAANLMVTAGFLWALAATAIVVELATGRDTATYLTSWQFADGGAGTRYGTIHWPSSLLTMLAALLIGMVAVWPAVRRGHYAVGAATSGAVGPLLVAAAFLVLAPRLTGSLGQLGSAYLIAPYAVLAGLAGSAFTVAVGQRAAERRKPAHHRPAPPAATGVAAVQADGGPEGHGPGELGRAGDEVTAELPSVRPEQVPAGARAVRPEQGPDGAQPVRPEEVVTAELEPVRPSSARSDTPATGPAGRAPATNEVPRAPDVVRRAAGHAPDVAEPAAAKGVERPRKQAPAATPAPRRRRPASGATAAAPDETGTARPDGRSTVAAPPASPPVARINPGREQPATGDQR